MNDGKEAISPQSQRFAEAARLAECDPDPAAFDAQLRVVAAHRPKPESKVAPKPRTKKTPTT